MATTSFPFLKPRPLARAAVYQSAFGGSRKEGFLGNGDFFDVTTTATGNVTYNDVEASNIWTYNPNNISGGSGDEWGGFMFDLTDNLLYCVVVNESTTPNTYFLASINAAGTINSIGNDQPSTDFPVTSQAWWGLSPNSNGATLIYRSADGVGNMFMIQTRFGASGRRMEIDITNGSIVSSPGDVILPLGICAIRSPNGVYLGASLNENSLGSTFPKLQSYTDFVALPEINLHLNCGYGQSTSARAVQWKGYITSFIAGANDGPFNWETDDYYKFSEDLARLFLDIPE